MVHWALVAMMLAAPAVPQRVSFAERIGVAYWLTIAEHPRLTGRKLELGKSPGLSLEIARPPAGHVHVELLFGTRSGGLGLFTRDHETKRARWSFGVGGVTKYASHGVWRLFAGLTVKFWAQCRCGSGLQRADIAPPARPPEGPG